MQIIYYYSGYTTDPSDLNRYGSYSYKQQQVNSI